MLAHHGLVEDALLGEVAVQADPVHLPALPYLLLPHHGDVVLHLAGEDAKPAPHAAGEVHGHGPGVLPLGPGG